MLVMLTNEGYYCDMCTTQLNVIAPKTTPTCTCDEQQVGISMLFSAILLSEFTVLPGGILLDYVGPTSFSLFIFTTHVVSLVATIFMSRNTYLLCITFFLMGTSAQACSLLAMRTVYIFDTPRAKKRWLVACCTVFDSSAICTMIFFSLWEVKLIRIEDMYWTLAILGGVLYGAQHCLWNGLDKVTSKAKTFDIVTEEFPLLENQLNSLAIEETVDKEENNLGLSLSDIFLSYKFYFFVLLCAVNIYRIRYFLGVADYTLKYLNDTGFYLNLLGYCFILSAVFAPIVDKILSNINNTYLQLHIVNASVTAYFVTWLIPSLPVQIITFALFILARLFTFAVLSDYCAVEFHKTRFGLVFGAGFTVASIPGVFMFKLVEVVLAKFNGNFWIFHLICIGVSLPLGLIIWSVQRNSEPKLEQVGQLTYITSDVQVVSTKLLDGRTGVSMTPRSK
jgi:hypothetical protein